jgi:hypothetical protein
MKTLAVILILLTTLSGYAQTTANTDKKPGHFYWSASKAKDIPIGHTLAKETRLNNADKKELARIISERVKETEFADDKLSAKEFQELIWQTRIELVDLNGDGVPEILAQGYSSRMNCGATGNCEFFVFEKTLLGIELLLDTYKGDGSGVELYTVEETSTHGFKDLVLTEHESAFESTLFVYKFDGKRYKKSTCYSARWDYQGKRGFEMRKNPVISLCEE